MLTYLASLKPLIISVVTKSSSVEENIKTKNVIGMDTITKANLETIINGTDNLFSQLDQLQETQKLFKIVCYEDAIRVIVKSYFRYMFQINGIPNNCLIKLDMDSSVYDSRLTRRFWRLETGHRHRLLIPPFPPVPTLCPGPGQGCL